MRDWNVVVTVREHRFNSSFSLLEPLGEVQRTRFYNVLTMRVPSIREFLETLRDWLSSFPETADTVARAAPVTDKFVFSDATDFRTSLQRGLAPHLPELAGQRFFVRMQLRGAGLHPSVEERALGEQLTTATAARHAPARVDFGDPDVVVAVESIGHQAGWALWSRADRQRYPCLGLGASPDRGAPPLTTPDS